MNRRPIIYCYDGSEPAKHALVTAAKLFAHSPALVVTVWRSAWGATAGLSYGILPPEDVDLIDDGSGRAAAVLAAEGAASIPGAYGHALKTVDSVWERVLDFADAHDAAVIVVGVRGLSGFKSRVLGSVSHGLVNHSSWPVLVVPPTD